MNAPLSEQRLAEIRSLDLLALMSERSAATVSGHLAALLAEVSRLRAERHSTNEALSDAAEALRVQRDRIAELEALTPAPIQTCRKCGAGYTYGQPCSACQFQTLMAAAQAKRQAEDPHDSPLHHDYALGRDLPTTHPTDAGSAL